MSGFRKQLEKVSEFFKPENLARQKIKYKGPIALLVIDAQGMFANPAGKQGSEATEAASRRIQSIVPEFRKAGVPIYAVYYSHSPMKRNEVNFYKFELAPEDKLVRKNRDSAFEGSDIKKMLKKDGRKLLLVCGFNFSACVRWTVEDARKHGFDVCVLSDLSANGRGIDPSYIKKASAGMAEKGATFENSEKALKLIKARRKAP